MNTVELKLKLSFSSCTFDVSLTSDFLGNSFTVDPHTHGHPFYEFQYVEKGTCRFQWDQQELFCPEGTILLIPPHTHHIILPEGENTVTITFLYQPNSNDNSSGLARLFSVATPTSFPDHTGLIYSGLLNIRQELKQRSSFFQEKIRGDLTLLFARIASSLEAKPEDYGQEQGENRAQVIENYIASHCFDPNASITELAASLHLSSRQLHRQCIAFFGIPFRTKLYRTRMEIAKYRLDKKAESVASLSRKLGYASPSAFSAAYKRYYGSYPTGK